MTGKTCTSISLRTRKQSRNYHQPNFNLLYLRKLPWAHSIFLHITSGHNDLATEIILSKFVTTQRSRSITFILLFTQTAMPCLVRGMYQLNVKTNVSSLCQLQTWGESTFNDSESESDSGRLFDSESDSSQFGYDSESNFDSSNISISDSESESDSNFQLLI